jgi:hypothetical protein
VDLVPPTDRADPSGALASRNEDAVRLEATRCESGPAGPEATVAALAPVLGPPLDCPTGAATGDGAPQTLQ